MLKAFCILFICFMAFDGLAQVKPEADSFFLAKKKGLWGRLGRSITISTPEYKPRKSVEDFFKYNNYTIRTIEIIPLPYDVSITDTTAIREKNFFKKIADKLHRTSAISLIRKNLFFKEGESFVPLLVSDNARWLRSLPFLRDAFITAEDGINENGQPVVDVTVITRDVFSLGAEIEDITTSRLRISVDEENLGGYGNQLNFGTFVDKNRKTGTGFAANYTQRNISNTFIDWKLGFSQYAPTFFHRQMEENIYYTSFQKPLVSRYTKFTGGLKLAYHRTMNQYNTDSVYSKYRRYAYKEADFWTGYNIGASTGIKTDNFQRLRHFVAWRLLYKKYSIRPTIAQNVYNWQFADENGMLLSYSIFKQNFYRTNFIYGFGRFEDIPVGLNASITTGYINNSGNRRAYLALEFDAKRYSEKDFFSHFIFKLGGFTGKQGFEDVNLISGVEHFTKLRYLNPYWRQRFFTNLYYTQQFAPRLSPPLLISSEYGIPYFYNGSFKGDTRSRLYLESTFYNLKKLLGFRFAPFLFGDGIMLGDFQNSTINKKEFFSAFGGGLRIRNESLIFGTMELRAAYVPRPIERNSHLRFSFGTNIRFQYNSEFIHQPAVILPN